MGVTKSLLLRLSFSPNNSLMAFETIQLKIYFYFGIFGSKKTVLKPSFKESYYTIVDQTHI